MEWHESKLGEYLTVEHGFAFKGEHFTDSGELVVLTPGNFYESGGFRSRPGKDRFYSASFPDRYLLKKGDLIVAMTEQGEGLLGSSAIIPESDRYLHNQRLGLVKEKPSRADRRFLYYLFNTPAVREQIRNSSSGAKVRHTSPERIYSVPVCIPEVRAQRKIAAILVAYDDLIADNQRRIALLERIAEEIYREWFVRMRFPGSSNTKMSKGIPGGWSQAKLDSILSESKRALKKADLASVYQYVGLEHIPRKTVVLDAWGKPNSVDSDKLRFSAGDILFGKIRPYLHKVSIAPFDGACSTDIIVLQSRKANVALFAFFTVFSETFVNLATAASKGTKMPRADWHFLKDIQLAVPPDVLLTAFNSITKPMIDLATNLLRVNQSLATARDLILPRLISGKQKIDHLDIRIPLSMEA